LSLDGNNFESSDVCSRVRDAVIGWVMPKKILRQVWSDFLQLITRPYILICRAIEQPHSLSSTYKPKNMLSLLKFITPLLFASFVAAQLTITSPSSSIWWVAKSLNLINWTCKTSPYSNFTVLINNSNPKILTAPIAVIAIQENYDCSITITQDQANQPVGTGWSVIFANPLNSSDAWATSEPFEIKALGSAYPSQVTVSAGGSSTASSSSPFPTRKSGAVSLKAGLTAVGLAAFGIVTLFA